MAKIKYKRRDKLEAELKELEKEYSKLEYKLGCILDTVTGGCISKPHTDKTLINEAIHRQVMKEWEYAIKDYKESNPLPSIENTICNWKKDNDDEYNVYNTGCEESQHFSNDENPSGNNYKFCPFCGGEIKVVSSFSLRDSLNGC